MSNRMRIAGTAFAAALGATLLSGTASAATKIEYFFPVAVDGKLAQEMTNMVKRFNAQQSDVDVVPVYAGDATVDQAVTRYFVTHYITICERFNFETAESDYEECGAFHAAQRNQAWSALWNKNNPASPLNVHKDGSTVRAQVESVSFFQRGNGVSDLAQVRYVKAERQGSGATEHITHWIATLQYVYTTVSKDPRVRRWNPLGFKIVEIVSEPEVLATTPATTQ